MKFASFAKKFSRNEKGNFSVIMAMTMMPLTAAIGLAIDYNMMSNEKVQMQQALDAAALGALTARDISTDAQRQTRLQALYTANGGKGTATLNSSSTSSDSRLTLNVSARYDAPLTLMRMANRTTGALGAISEVQGQRPLETLKFQVIKATGWWDKSITLKGRQKGQTTYNDLAQINYSWNGKTGGDNVGNTKVFLRQANGDLTNTSSMTCTTNKQRDCTTSGNPNATVDVRTIDDMYLEQKVSAPLYLDAIKLLTQMLAEGIPQLVKSNDPNYANRLYVGPDIDHLTQLQNGKAVDIFRLVPCETWSTQAWEDGGGWDQRDFFYKIQGHCGEGLIQTKGVQILK